MGFFRCWKIKDAEGGNGVISGDGGEIREVWVHGEAGLDDLGFRQALADEGLAGALIGDEPVVGGCLAPGGVDFDGVGDDGENRNFCSGRFFKDAFEEVGVERVGADDGTWLVPEDEFAELVFWSPHEGDALAREILAFGGEVDFPPEPWGMGGDGAVAASQAFVEERGAEGAGVSDDGGGVVCESGLKIAGGAVVPIAESGGEDKDIRVVAIRFAHEGRQ